MTLILSIETSTRVCSVALHLDKRLLGVQESFADRSHSKVLLDQVSGVLKQAGYELNQIDAVAVSKGPGSYTGLRIGVSTAKGLCFSLGKPLIGINTLEAMAFEVNRNNISGYYVCPMLDARRMEVYCCMMDSDNLLVLPVQAMVLNEDSFNEFLDHRPILFSGDGSEKCKELLKSSKNAFFIENLYPSAKNIGFMAFDQYERSSFEDPAYFEPFYLKEFVSSK